MRYFRSLTTLLLACLCLCGPGVYAGLPQPGMVLAGSAYDGTGALLTQGQLTVTYTPTTGGSAFTQRCCWARSWARRACFPTPC